MLYIAYMCVQDYCTNIKQPPLTILVSSVAYFPGGELDVIVGGESKYSFDFLGIKFMATIVLAKAFCPSLIL